MKTALPILSGSYRLTKVCRSEATNDKTIPPTRAGKNPSMVNPGTIRAATHNTKAEIIQEKSPKVIKFTGRVKRINIGFKNAFSKPKTKAAITAVLKSAT